MGSRQAAEAAKDTAKVAGVVTFFREYAANTGQSIDPNFGNDPTLGTLLREARILGFEVGFVFGGKDAK